MQPSRCLLVVTTLFAAAATFAEPGKGMAPILPEVKKQLAAAHQCLATGSWETASAHADLVLISDTVSVNVNLDTVRGNQKANCVKALQACLDQWETALEGAVHFRMETDPAKADLTVTFRSDVRMKREPVAGLTNWTRKLATADGKTTATFKADVQVRTQDLNYRSLSFEAMRQETEHEFGHILGLEDSARLGDLMGELDMGHLVSSPRGSEIQAVKDIRAEAKRVKADAEARCSGQ